MKRRISNPRPANDEHAKVEDLRQSLEKNRALVREIHHRVKNNLQTIVSLLTLEASHVEDPRLRAAFEETRTRVRAIAQVHEERYTSEDLRDVECGAYIKGLAGELVSLDPMRSHLVRLQVSVEEIFLPMEKAISLGLIANELILNSLKHGLRERSGTIHVALEALKGGEAASARLQVGDTGPGFPPGFDASKATSMGYRLINMLLRQLRGRMEAGTDGGASVTVTFPFSGIPDGA